MKNTRTLGFLSPIGVSTLLIAALAIAQQTPTTGDRTPLLQAVGTTESRGAAPYSKKSLYDRLGGVFAISAVIDHFSDALIDNPIVGKTSQNPALRKWSTQSLGRLPGLKFMRTLWVCKITGGPFEYTPTVRGKTKTGLDKAHEQFNITSAEFNEVAAELGRTLDFFKVPRQEKREVLAAFAAHKNEVLGRRP